MREAWYPVHRSEKLPKRTPVSAKLLGDPIVLFRGEGGRPSCFLDSCPHRSIPLSLGRVANERLVCGYHGWQFDGAGRCTFIPPGGSRTCLTPNATARTYPALERYGVIWVWPGNPSMADENLFPLPHPEVGDRILTDTITTEFGSRFDLVMDHGLDMPHFVAIHSRTLVRIRPQARSGFPHLEGIAEQGDSLTMRWRVRWSKSPVVMKAFRPCNLLLDLPFNHSGTRSMQQVVFFTPNDREKTTGTLFAYRNFMNMPILSNLVSLLFRAVMAKGRTEDDEVFAGQLANEKLGARSVAGWSYDIVGKRYASWQNAQAGPDMWFRDLHHARLRYGSQPVGETAPNPNVTKTSHGTQ